MEALPYLSIGIDAVAPETMEHYGQYYGYILYRTRLETPGMFNLYLEDRRDFGPCRRMQI